MIIWTIKEGEPLPLADCPGRQMRCGIISAMLAERGHDVTWWTSNFFHQTKTRLRNEETIVDITEKYRLHLLHAKTVYKKNISIERVKYSRQLGVAFGKAARKEKKPDVIICSFPLIDFAYEAVRFGKENGVYTVVDVRDLWPDIIWEHFPKIIRPFVRLFCRSLVKKTEYVMKNADMVIGVIPKCMEFIENYGRVLEKKDEVYYLAYREIELSFEDKKKAIDFWKSKGVVKEDFLICWIGQISSQRTDFDMVCDVIAEMPQCKFVICGDGGSKSTLENKYKTYSNIVFPGFLNQEELETLMEMSQIGVIPIKDTPDFANTINNKAIEYMAGSLCILTTLKGLLRETIESNEMGSYFDNKENFRKEIIKLMENPTLLNKYKRNSRKYYEEHFDSKNVYGKLCNIVETINK